MTRMPVGKNNGDMFDHEIQESNPEVCHLEDFHVLSGDCRDLIDVFPLYVHYD